MKFAFLPSQGKCNSKLDSAAGDVVWDAQWGEGFVLMRSNERNQKAHPKVSQTQMDRGTKEMSRASVL